ncbi:MAG: hypothetical protein Q4D78_11125 [Neisseria zoodegmatis]|uniref:hypothetical protein n=1 Tax=Neisseria zoodegmatis TaxID=326523 RepID=UPI0026F20865|nr:hypothetical protein [Neisseria zoodegmatis]MDO5070721.1 hypothetical protein [Neisseria zoodegmatis]
MPALPAKRPSEKFLTDFSDGLCFCIQKYFNSVQVPPFKTKPLHTNPSVGRASLPAFPPNNA